jgi:hypothetical protein
MTEDTARKADAILDFTALSHRDRPDRLYLKIRGATSGERLYVMRLTDLDSLMAQLRRVVLDKQPPSLSPAGRSDFEEDATAAFDIARRVVADWSVSGASLGSLLTAMTAIISRSMEAQSGRAAAQRAFDAMADWVRHAPPLDAAGDHASPTAH